MAIQRLTDWLHVGRGVLALVCVACLGIAMAFGAEDGDPPAISPKEAGYSVTHWTTEDRLPGRVISSLAQTPDGYLWCSGPDGLCRFDGRRFRVFYPDEFPALKGIQFDEMRTGALPIEPARRLPRNWG